MDCFNSCERNNRGSNYLPYKTQYLPEPLAKKNCQRFMKNLTVLKDGSNEAFY